MKPTHSAILFGNGTFQVFKDEKDAQRLFCALHPTNPEIFSIGVAQVDDAAGVPLRNIVGKIGHHWYVRCAN